MNGRDLQRQLRRDEFNRWVVCFIIGVLTALVACFIDLCVMYSTELKFSAIRKCTPNLSPSCLLFSGSQQTLFPSAPTLLGHGCELLRHPLGGLVGLQRGFALVLLFSTPASWVRMAGFVAIASGLVVFFAGGVAAGSGIPQIKCFLNGVMIPGVVRSRAPLHLPRSPSIG